MSLSELWSRYGQNYIDALLATWGTTLESFAIAMVLAVAVTVMRVSPLKPLRVFGDLYVQVFRNIPGIALLIIVVYALPPLKVVLPYRTCVIVATVFLGSAFGSENFMSGLNTVGDGKVEIYNTTYSGYLEERAQREEMEAAPLRKNKSLYRKELAWIRRGAPARSTKAKGRIQRFDAVAEAIKEAPPEAELTMKSVASRLGKKILSWENLSIGYGENTLVRDFSYTLLRDDRLGIIGGNGAGKTTLLKILCGVNRAEDGTVALQGGSPADAATRAKIGVVFEDAFFYGSFTAAQVARSLAGMYGARWKADSLSAYLRRIGLDAGKKLKEYSRGMRLKLSLAAALAHDPELLVLDEATAGLDPVVRGELLDLFLEFIQDERHCSVMSSYISADLEQIADAIAYLHNGQLLFQENKDDLLQEYGVLHCGEDVLTSLPAGLVVFTRRGAYGCESLVRERRTVQELLPEAVCDAARLDDIMRFYSGRDAQ